MIAIRLLNEDQATLTKLIEQFAKTGGPTLTSMHELPSARQRELDVQQAIEEQPIRWQVPPVELETRAEKPEATRIPWPPI